MASRLESVQTTFRDFAGMKDGLKGSDEIIHKKGRLEEEYLEDCKARLSPHTVKSHECCLREFRGFLGKPVGKATKLDVRNFLNDLKSRGRARSTIAHKLAAIRSFFSYIREYHRVDTPDLSNVKVKDYPMSRWEGRGCVALEKSDIIKMLETVESLRNTLIIALLYFTGLRAHELAKIKLDSIDTEQRIIAVVGKGDKPRKVPYHPLLDRSLQLWIDRERKSYASSGRSPYLFPSKHGDRLTSNTIRRIVVAAAEEAGVQEIMGERADGGKIHKANPHAFRRSFATHGAESGIPLEDLRRMMGHSKQETTLIYIKESMERTFKSYHENFEGI
ncbi:hypothetical protein AKJ58_00590 [candidate division MSBL1 archaeon SCGC-AAA385D11]|uniref:Integrase n=1 Tax=candidate division MSBL1 archaeon SCGC-AAA385D11 TaxID=1698286 RepID=A0A133VP28_9EURY|nr:hypothetical protein AKJ58_00590 [candidate division MSBL1 archaeon SCGC-AAA385D11]